MYYIVNTYHPGTETISDHAICSIHEILCLKKNGVIVTIVYGPFNNYSEANNARDGVDASFPNQT